MGATCVLAVGCAAGRAAPGVPNAASPAARGVTFANPIVASRDAGDPWVVRHDGWYYFTATLDADSGVSVWRARTLTGLDAGEKRRVRTAPAAGPTSRQIWAPELHRLGGRWYLYFTASDGVDAHHRLYAMAARTDDPLGAYDPPARVDPLERYAIDGTVLQMPDGRLYFLCCADGPENGVYIAPMAGPMRVGDAAVRVVRGTEPWEHGWRKVAGRWQQDAGYWVCTPGHNGFTTSPDGAESWLVYHAKDGGPDSTGGNESSRRTVRAQRFTWGADGAPVFARPAPSGVRLRAPSGEDRA